MNSNKTNIRAIAFYLPQFHPIPDNDNWWGKGFTEWFNVGKAKPLFPGHRQPNVPTELGYYDLRVPETRELQAILAKGAGIEGFCYWHYWFGNGKQLLERPLDEIVETGKPDYPFCIAWANESWRGFGHGLSKKREVLIEQTYPGHKDISDHFASCLKYFKDKRYITVNGKPFFMIYKPELISNLEEFITKWKKLAIENGLPGIHFVAHANDGDRDKNFYLIKGFDAVYTNRFFCNKYFTIFRYKITRSLINMFFNIPRRLAYRKAIHGSACQLDSQENAYPGLLSGWDHTPRSGKNGLVLTCFNMKEWDRHVREVMAIVKDKKKENNIVMIKSWNEWAEGNFMEPDLVFGDEKLKILSKHLLDEWPDTQK